MCNVRWSTGGADVRQSAPLFFGRRPGSKTLDAAKSLLRYRPKGRYWHPRSLWHAELIDNFGRHRAFSALVCRGKIEIRRLLLRQVD